MSITVNNFWRLLGESRLLTPEQCQALHGEYARMNGAAAQGDAQALVDWLISRNALTKYQSKIIEAGRAGPFYYGDYKVYDRLEKKGPLGGAFRAIHTPTSHSVLLGFVAGQTVHDAQQWQRLTQHVQAQVAVVHPNLNRIYEPVDVVSFKFVALEDPPGEFLEQRSSGKPLRPPDACRVVRMAALGLQSIHESRQVHGDVRPRNLWLQKGGNVLLMRDPLFQPTPLHEAQTDASSDLLARSDFMAPELGQPGKLPDVLTDIYALGCTLYHLLTGRPPFADGDLMQKLARHATEPIQPLEKSGVPPQIGQLVAYMMAKNPSVRYQQAAVVAEQLTPFVDPPQLRIQPVAAPQTLPSYQQWIQQKSSALANQAATEMARPGPFPGITDSPSSAGAGPVGSQAVATATQGVADRFKSKRKSTKKKLMMAASLGVGLVGIAVIVIMAMNSGGSPDVADGEDPSTQVVDQATHHDPEKDKQPKDDGNGEAAVPDGDASGQDIQLSETLPWASPTTGSSITLDHMPPNPGIILVARPAELAAKDGSVKVLKALGPQFNEARQQWEKELGIPFNRIQQVIVSLHPAASGPPRSAFVVRLVEPMAEQTLLASWGNPKTVSVPEAETHYYEGGNGWSYYLPREDPNQAVDLIVMGSAEDVKGATVSGKTGAQELLRLQMKQLLKWSDEARHFTCLFEPNAVFNESGQSLLSGNYGKIRESLDWLLGDGIQAGMVSFHVGDSFYLEMRVKAMPGTSKFLLEHFQGRLSDLFKKVNGYIAGMGSNAHWEQLRLVYPMQVKYLKDRARVGIEDDQALLNSYMPLRAAHNLIAGTELAIAAPSGTSGPVTPPPTQPVAKSLEELLEMKLDLVDIPQHDLINAVAEIKDMVLDTYRNLPFEFDIFLVGPELMGEGITQNQPVRDFRMEKSTISEVLTGIMMKANTVPGVQVPTETDQKLVWVIGPDPKTPGRTILLITTRTAANGKPEYKLGKPFQP